MHILDIAENGIRAGASLIRILVEEDRLNNLLRIRISDNGGGMPSDFSEKAVDPFVTSRSTRRVGLGLSLFKEAALQCNGSFQVESKPDQGTRIETRFEYRHIDRAPIGDMAGTLTTLIFGNPNIDFQYTHIVDGENFSLDTRDLKGEGVSLQDPDTIGSLSVLIQEGLTRLCGDL